MASKAPGSRAPFSRGKYRRKRLHYAAKLRYLVHSRYRCSWLHQGCGRAYGSAQHHVLWHRNAHGAEAARILRRSPRRLPLYCIALSAGLTTLTLLWTVLLLVGLPHGLESAAWRHMAPHVSIGTSDSSSHSGRRLGIGAGVGLHALGAARRSMRATLIGSGLILAFSLWVLPLPA